MRRTTSLEDLSLSLPKLRAIMHQSVADRQLRISLAWPYAFSHLPESPSPSKPREDNDRRENKDGKDKAAQGEIREPSAEAAYELAQDWIERVVEKLAGLLCSLHQVRNGCSTV